GPLAVHRAPAADRVLAGRAAVFELLDEIEAAEAARPPLDVSVYRTKRRADGARLARIGVDQDFGIRHFRFDEIDLRLHHGHIPVRAALQHELPTDGAQVLELTGVDPDVQGEYGREPRHDLFGRPALALLIDDVRLQEHPAAHREPRHGPRLECLVRVFLERDAVALGHALQEGAIARGTLRVQPEVGNSALPQDHDFHVGAADIANH